jgi:NADH:ubiquinone oxidoreductase subunit K
MPTAHSIQSIRFLAEFSESVLAYPIVLSIHLACIALFGGMILATDLRLLGLTFNSVTITELVTSLRPWKRVGGTVMIAMGLLLAASEAEKYAPNPFFWTKMIILGSIGVHALIFRPIVYSQTEELDASPVIPTKAKVAAILSLMLWTAMFVMGRLIAYWD